MCWQIAIPIITAAVSGGTTLYANNQAAAKRSREGMALLRTQRSNQNQADQLVSQLVDKQAASNPQNEINTAKEGYMKQLMANAAQSNAGLSDVSGASSAYQDAAKNAALGITNYGANRADLTARITGPGQQRDREAIERANFGSQLSNIVRNSKQDDYLSKLRMDSIQANPALLAIAAAAQGFGGSKGSGGFGGWGGSPASGVWKDTTKWAL